MSDWPVALIAGGSALGGAISGPLITEMLAGRRRKTEEHRRRTERCRKGYLEFLRVARRFPLVLDQAISGEPPEEMAKVFQAEGERLGDIEAQLLIDAPVGVLDAIERFRVVMRDYSAAIRTAHDSGKPADDIGQAVWSLWAETGRPALRELALTMVPDNERPVRIDND